jgi:hypothetical protein
MSEKGKDFIDTLVEQEKKKEESNIIYLDIETGKGKNNNVINVRASKIRAETEKEKYSWKDGWKDETNIQKEAEFKADLPKRIQKKIKDLTKMDAVSPWFNRICLIGVMDKNGVYEYVTEIDNTEKEMVEWLSKKIENKIIVTYGDFDLKTIDMKAIANEMFISASHNIDIMRQLGMIWNIFNKKEVLSQDELAAVFNIEPNRYLEEVDPSTIGDTFENFKNDLSDVTMDDIIEIINYNQEDLRVLKDIHEKAERSIRI